MNFCVRIIQPEYYPHWQTFTDLADGLRAALVELNCYDANGRQIVLCAHMQPYSGDAILDDAIIFNSEVVGAVEWFTPKYLALLASHEVWDYSADNVRRLARQSIKAKHCPVGFHERLMRVYRHAPGTPGVTVNGIPWSSTDKMNWVAPDIDVLFYGSMTPRRVPIWDSICATGLNCVHLFGVYGEARDAFIARAKIVLNLHAYPMSPREDVRLSYLWANKAFVLSEGSSGPFEYTAEQLPESCKEWVRRDFDRHFFANTIHESFKLQRQADYLRPLIAAEKAPA